MLLAQRLEVQLIEVNKKNGRLIKEIYGLIYWEMFESFLKNKVKYTLAITGKWDTLLNFQIPPIPNSNDYILCARKCVNKGSRLSIGTKQKNSSIAFTKTSSKKTYDYQLPMILDLESTMYPR